jgi:uncharacterized protein (TIGR01777 family)
MTIRARVLVTGATGFIGSRVVDALRQRGAHVTALTRDVEACRQRLGPHVQVMTMEDAPAGLDFDAVVNLAGARIAPIPWTTGRREMLRRSRINLTRWLVQRFKTVVSRPPSVWVQASAVGYYGLHDAANLLTERSAQGDDFAAQLCGDWEAAAAPIADAGTRVCTLRLGLVLGPGGALPGLLLPIRMGLGGPLGSGKQAFPWLHVEDAVALILDCIDNPLRHGTYNAVAPDAHTQESFARCAACLLARPFWLPVPAIAIRMLGQVSQLFLDGQQVVPDRLQREGWAWRHPELAEALINILTGRASVRK